MAFTAVIGGLMGMSAMSSRKALKSQERAQEQASTEARKQSLAAERANNRANAKVPDLGGLVRANAAGSNGIGSTMLTGASGIDPDKMLLGKSTLLGS